MHYFYSDTEKDDAGFKGINTNVINPHKPYLRHVANWFQLKFMYQASDNLAEKFQITREMTICERKMDFWYKKPLFDPTAVADEIKKLKGIWKNVEFVPGQFDTQQQSWIKQKKWASK